MRVYLPVTVARLAQLLADSELRAASGTAFALTPALREAYSSGGVDELEHAAFTQAARAALRLLAIEGAGLEGAGVPGVGVPGEPGAAGTSALLRRGVLSADVDGATLRPDLDDAVVRLSGPVRLDQVAAVHLDLAAAEGAVSAAIEAVDAADMGDLDAELIVGEATDHELAWYAPQELGFLLELF